VLGELTLTGTHDVLLSLQFIIEYRFEADELKKGDELAENVKYWSTA
jgi:hypothetical protein